LTDVYQLLKASSICKEDLSQIDQEGFYQLVMKKWKEIHPGTEFRCFVKDRNLIAISPRDWPQFHEHFKSQKQDIIKDIVSLFKEKIKEKFPIENCKSETT
jgi:D123